MRRIDRRLDDLPTLLVVGALAGAFAGAATVTLGLLAAKLSLRDIPSQAVMVGVEIGAPLGAILFPLTLRLWIPHVPLGRAAVSTTGATIAGGTLAWFVPQLMENALLRSVYGGCVGFILTVLVLKLLSDAEDTSRSATSRDSVDL
jgi:heme A synthase